MALTVYTRKDNQWREYVNPLRGLTPERIVIRPPLSCNAPGRSAPVFFQAPCTGRTRRGYTILSAAHGDADCLCLRVCLWRDRGRMSRET